MKSVAAALAVWLCAAPAFAQEPSWKKMEAVRAQQQEDVKTIKQKTGVPPAVIANYTIRIVVGTGVLLAAAYGVREAAVRASYARSDREAVRLSTISRQMDLYEAQQAASKGLEKGAFYPAGKLGKANIEWLNGRLESWKNSHIYEVPRVFSVSNSLAYRVKAGAEKEFEQKAAAVYFDYIKGLRITEHTLLPAGETGLDVYLKGLRAEFDQIMTRSVHEGGALRGYVSKVTSKGGEKALARAMKGASPKAVGRVGVFYANKFLPLIPLALVWAWAAPGADEDAAVRMAVTPSLLIDLTDEQFEKVVSSEKLSKQYVLVSDALHQLARLPDDEMAFVVREAQKQKVRDDAAFFTSVISDALSPRSSKAR